MLFKTCKKYGIPAWKCPQFLFIMMGFLTIGSMLGTFFFFNTRGGEAEIMIVGVIAVTLIIFVPGSLIVRSFEYIAEADHMKSEFVSIASHQLRSPLSAIKWSLNLLLDGNIGKLDKKQTQYLNTVEQNNNRMIKLVNDLLNVSRIDQRTLKLKKINLNTKDIVEEVVASLRPSAESNNVKLELNLPHHVSEVLGDDIYFDMVITNLIDNAIRYSKEEGGLVKINLSEKQGILRCEISDNGIGISRDEQGLVFNKFFRAEAAEAKQSVGTGLGLFIAKSVIKKMGGRMGFNSREGEGTTFWFEVPTIKN